MIVGVAQVDITPEEIVELSGFAAREQPMMGVLDRIHVKALYLAHADQKLLWLNADVLVLSAQIVKSIRAWAASELGVSHVLLSATHTHAAPAVVHLTGCGKPDAEYLQSLESNMKQSAREAMAGAKSCALHFAATDFPLAVDRRGKPSAHVDSRLSALAWKGDRDFIAGVVNYPMHPVTLGHVNRMISADWCGGADEEMQRIFSKDLVTLVTNGACGNLNPPRRPVPPAEAYELGRRVARAIGDDLAASAAAKESLRTAIERIDMPLDWMEPSQIERIAADRLNEFGGTPWARPFGEAIENWRDTQIALVKSGGGKSMEIELFAIDLGPVIVLAVNGELFSRFTATVRQRSSKPIFVVGYANAAFGYIPTREAYEEGGYEVNDAHLFYNSFRPKPGSLEMLADRAAELVRGFKNE